MQVDRYFKVTEQEVQYAVVVLAERIQVPVIGRNSECDWQPQHSAYK